MIARKLLLSISLFWAFQILSAQDTAFVTKGFFVTEDYNMITCSAKQPDGKILISGTFSHYNGIPCTNLIRLNSNGSRDTSFNNQIGTDGDIQHILVQPDGKIILQGVFRRYKQQTVTNGLVRIFPNGDMDNTFIPFSPISGYNGVTVMDLQADGKLVIGGYGLGVKGYDSSGIIRLNVNGTLDQTFTSTYPIQQNAWITAVKIDHSGKILVGGDFKNWNGRVVRSLVRLNSNGFQDTTFQPQKDGVRLAYNDSTSSIYINTIQELPDASLFIGGFFSLYDSSFRMGIAKIHPDGSLDTSFKPDPTLNVSNTFIVQSIAFTSNNKILVGGHFYFSNSPNYTDLFLLQSNGSFDSGNYYSGPDPSLPYTAGGINKIYVNPDNSFVATGVFTGYYNSSYQNNISLYSSPLVVDNTYKNGFQRKGSIYRTAIQKDNSIFVAGDFNQYDVTNNQPMQRIALLSKRGSLDTSFHNTKLNAYVSDISLGIDSTITAVGSFTAAGSVPIKGVARFKLDGSLDTGFNPGNGPDIANMYCVQTYSNQYVYVGGSFAHFGGSAHQGIVRLLWNGQVDTTFKTSSTPIYAPNSLEATSDGKVLVAENSDKTIRDYLTPLRVYRLLNDGSLDNSFQTPKLGWSLGQKIKQGQNGSIYWLGTLIQGATPNNYKQTLLRLKQDGSLDSSAFSFPQNYFISDFNILPDSNLVVSGQEFDGLDSTFFVMRLKPDLSIDSSFIPVSLYYSLKNINYTPEGNIVVAGEPIRFFRLASEQVANIALLRNSSMQISTTTAQSTKVVKNILDAVPITQTTTVGSSYTQNFTASNPSNLNLSLLDPSKVIITGANASEFSVTINNNSSVINKKDSLPFRIVFTPSSSGSKSIKISIPYSNGVNNLYSFMLSANATDNITAIPTVPTSDRLVSFYPNPNSGNTVYIHSNQTFMNYSIVDLSGKEIKRGAFSDPYSEYQSVSIKGFTSGIYFIHLMNKKANEVVKVVVAR